MKALNLFLLLLVGIFSSCDKVTEKYLFDEDDDEYEWAQELALSECITDAAIFGEFDDAAEFDDSNFSVGDIFKIKQDDNEGVVIYAKINAINSQDMEIIFSSADDDYRKIVTFEESDHEKLVDVFQTIACNDDYEDYFATSGLNSSTQMSFTWDLETILESDDDDDDDDDPEAYKYVTKELTVSKNYPLFFYFYNGKKSYEYVLEDGDEATTKESNITITEVTDEDECDNENDDQNDYCDFDDLDSSSFPICTVEVDEDAYSSRGHNTNIISLSGTDCKLLESAGVSN